MDKQVKLPEKFCNRVLKDWDNGNSLLQSLDTDSPTSIRLNPSKLVDQFESESIVQWCEMGRYLAKRPVFTLDPYFHAGAYYPQEAGSMFIQYLYNQLKLPPQPLVLDLCAAPGGKSTQLLDCMKGQGTLISNEVIRNRAFILRDNLTKWGYSNCIVTNNKASDFKKFQELFDCILVDAPCSGEGMFRKDLNARNEWSVENTLTCEKRQNEILEEIINSLKVGGYLIYSTCTFNRLENEKQVEKICQNHFFEPVPLNIEPHWGLNSDTQKIGYYCLPSQMETEGFYFAVLQKTKSSNLYINKNYLKSEKRTFSNSTIIPDRIKNAEQYHFSLINDFLYAFPKDEKILSDYFQKELKILKWGTRLGKWINKKLIPDYELAMNHSLSEDFEKIDLTKSNALGYLKGETFSIQAKEGWNIVRYNQMNLGFIKVVGNRVNNYYPKELRIKMNLMESDEN